MHNLRQTIPVLLVAALFASFALVALPAPAARGQTCPDLVANGDFETTGGWQLEGDPAPPQIVASTAHQGAHSLQLTLTTGANVESVSSAQQTVTIPSGATQATLSFWVYTVEPPTGKDYLKLSFLSPDGAGTLAEPWAWDPNTDGPAWTQHAYDLSQWQGQAIRLDFSAYNDGTGGRTGMYLDDVTLTACSSAAAPTSTSTLGSLPGQAAPALLGPTATPTTMPPLPTWTPTPLFVSPTWTPTPEPPVLTATPTATLIPPPPVWTPTPLLYPPPAETPAQPEAMLSQPVPPGCTEFTRNGGFEAYFAEWRVSPNPLLPTIVSAPVLSGAFSAQLGSQVQNRNSYSSIRQTVSVPPGDARTFVSFWTYTWAENAAGGGWQQFVLLGPGNAVWAVPWKVLENAQVWQQHIFELVGVNGRTFDLYFAAVNDGVSGRVALYLDEVHLWSCGGQAYPLMTGQMVVPAEAQTLATPIALPQGTEAQAVPTFETVPAGGLEGLRAVTTPALETAPSPDWTQVSIGPVTGLEEPAATLAAAASTLATVVPLLKTPVGAATQASASEPAPPPVTISLGERLASFLRNLTSRWPPNWPYILLGIILVVVLGWLLVRVWSAVPRWLRILLGILVLAVIVFLILRSLPRP